MPPRMTFLALAEPAHVTRVPGTARQRLTRLLCLLVAGIDVLAVGDVEAACATPGCPKRGSFRQFGCRAKHETEGVERETGLEPATFCLGSGGA